ncbi:MAG: hypothetical protein AAB691_04765 [Patescibacteria group bacterium]
MLTIRKEITLSLFIILLAVLESKTRLWSGNTPNLLIPGLIGLGAVIPGLELIFYTLLGFLFLAGPVASQELLVALVIIVFAHFLRLFVFGPSPVLAPVFSALGIIIFYLETVGSIFLFQPLFLFEIILMSCLISFLPTLILSYLESSRL